MLLGEETPGARPPEPALVARPSAASSSRCGSCRCSPLWLALGGGNVFTEIAVFFSKMAVVTFGGAYAVLAYVAQQAVEHYQLG